MPAPRSSDADPNGNGTQAIRRAAAILRRIVQADSQGVGLSAIIESVKLPRSTAHRILKCLVEEGFVRHDQEKRRYLIGRLTHELSLSVTSDTFGVSRWRDAVDRVAQRTGVTCYLLSRSGIEAVCLLKTEGNAAIRVIPVEVGQRRLLGVGAGSTALLAALDPATCEHVIKAIVPLLPDNSSLTAAAVRRMVDEARATGFAVSRSNVVRDAIGVGMAIPSAAGNPTLALSVAGLASQADDAVVTRWKQIIKSEIEAVISA